MIRRARTGSTQGAVTRRPGSRSASLPGKRDATWPSAPRPRRIRSKRGACPSLSPKYDFSVDSYALAAAAASGLSAGIRCTFPGGTGTFDSRVSSAIR